MTAAPRPPLSEMEIAHLEQRLSWVDVSSHLIPAEVKYDVAQWKRALAELRSLRAAVAPEADHVSLGGTKVGEAVCMPKEKHAALLAELHSLRAVADAAERMSRRAESDHMVVLGLTKLRDALRAAGRLATGTENSDVG